MVRFSLSLWTVLTCVFSSIAPARAPRALTQTTSFMGESRTAAPDSRQEHRRHMVYVGSTRHALPLWYTLARRAAALLSRPAPVEAPAGDASPPCAALERAAHSNAEPSGAAL